MKKVIYCKTTAKGTQSFYLRVGSRDYFLFTQKYRVGLKDYFANGVDINKLSAGAKHHNTAVRRVSEKLPAILNYIEKEYNVEVYDRDINCRKQSMKTFNWRNYLYNEGMEDIKYVDIV